MKPLAIDLFAGLGGWTEGLLACGFYVVGFDIERHQYGDAQYPAQLVLQDVLTLSGRQFRDAALIVASPPCQEYSYMSMPWSLAKKKRAEYLDGTRDVKDLTALFDACFRIQREAIEATRASCPACNGRGGHFSPSGAWWPCAKCNGIGSQTRHIPLVVENVRGACEWVGRSRWNFGSFHLWGDVPALMPMAHVRKDPFRAGRSSHQAADMSGWGGIKCGGDWFNDSQPSISRLTGSKSKARKAASAQIAKIPLPLATWIGKYWKPQAEAA